MSTHIRTISIGFMVLLLLCAPCMAACPYADSEDKAQESTCPYANPTCDGSSCSSCSGNSGSCSGSSGSCSGNSADVYGAFKCESGNCTAKVYEDGQYATNAYTNTGAADSKGAVVCKDGNCQGKVCNGTSCETGTFSLYGNSLKSWFDSLFGGSDSQETVVPEETPASTTYSVPKTTTSSTNFYGDFASESATPEAVEDTTPVAVEETVPVSEDTTIPACNNGSTCGKCTSGNTCSTCDSGKPCNASADVKPACETETTTAGVAAYDTVYNALRADKTEKNILSESYTSLNFAQDVCASMSKQGIDCTVCKATFTDGKVSYYNKIQTDQGELKVDSCGTASGTGIKKVINTLEVGKQWKSTSLFNQCTKAYDKGIVASIECL